MFYHNNQIGASCSYATSTDFKTWSYKGKLFTNYSIIDSKGEKNDRRYSNCDGLVLSNGDILAVASYRANNGYRDLPNDAGIEMRRSTDNGVTWSEPVSVMIKCRTGSVIAGIVLGRNPLLFHGQ